MPHEPKKRHSRARQGKRRVHIKLHLSEGTYCPNCKSPKLPHTICKECGFYNGRQVLTVDHTVVRKTQKEE